MRTGGQRFLAQMVVVVAVVGAAAASRPAARKPNILFISSDDHAAHAIGAYGGRLASLNPTPNIDRLARDGMLLQNVFCANAICVPSRATIMTGQYSHTNGVKTLVGGLRPAEQSLAHGMRAAGYQTAMIGKWHLEHEPAFDYYAVLPGQGSYFNPILHVSDKPWPDNQRRFAAYDSLHSSDVITDLSLEWLTKRNRSKPFFLMHHFKAPHDNYENAERYDWLYGETEIPEPETLWRTPNHGSEATRRMGTSVSKRNARRNMGQHMFVNPDLPEREYTRTAYQRYLKKYLRCVRGVDDNIGRLLAHLKQSGELENTVVIYTSDQGLMLGEHDYIDKRWMYDESMRMPFLVRYPGVVKPGSRSDALINNTDFAPTLLDIAQGSPLGKMQGRSFVPVLRGAEPRDWRTATYYRYWMHMAHHDNPAHYGIRTKEYKLIFFYGLPLDAAGARKKPTQPGWELYDLRKDPLETANVYGKAEYAGVTGKLKSELQRIKEQIGDTDERYPELMQVRRKYWD